MGLRSYPLHCCKRRNRSHFAYRLDVETMRVLCQAIPYGSASHFRGELTDQPAGHPIAGVTHVTQLLPINNVPPPASHSNVVACNV